MKVPSIQLDVANGWVWLGRQQCHLKPQAFAVLRYLVERARQVVSKEELLAAAWPGITVSAGVLKTAIWEIRQALDDPAEKPRFIETVPRRGYRFIAPVTTTQPVRSSEFGVRSPTPHTLHPTPWLVGRATELGQLHGWWENALQGQRQIVFVTGGLGIGKTTLVDAFLQQVAVRPNIWIARGQCIEHYGTSEAYLPVLTALGRLCRGAGGKHLLKLLHRYAPTWLVQLPAFLSSPVRERLERETRGVTRERMLREIAEAVEAITAARGLILWIDDLQWSDVSTLDFVSFLAPRHERAQLLIIGTYRPVDILGNGHPLRAISQELAAHGQCRELQLGPLSEADMAEYLIERFAVGAHSSAPLRGLAHAIHQRTEGNPLFMVNAVDYLLALGAITRVDGQWDLHRAVASVQNGVPPSIQRLIERQIDQVSPEEQRVLEVASVAGAEFSAAAVAAGLEVAAEEVERQCAELARRALFLRPNGITKWPDGTVAARYGFLHTLYQQVLYERVPAGQRIGFHQRIGERVEQAYGTQARTVAAELAVHFERGRDFSRALHYLRQAGENATRRSAHGEAVSLFTKGLELLQMLPQTPERTQQEIRLHLALAAPLITLKGYASPEVEYSYTQARKLCEQIGETRYLFPTVLGLCAVRHNQAEFREAGVLAQQLLRLAYNEGETTRLLWAHVLSGQVSYQTGKFPLAQQHFVEGIALYDAHRHSPYISDVIQDPGLHCRSYLAETLWVQGYADQARQRCHEALSLARQLGHAHSKAIALASAALLHSCRREQEASCDLAEELIALAREQGFPQWLAVGTFRRGWTLVMQGQAEQGLKQMRQGMTIFQATGAKLARPSFFCDLAWAHGRAGQVEEGLALLTDALNIIATTGEHVSEAEVYRLKGELLLRLMCRDEHPART
jgi:predicted ATPase/DNA-binding winged helix-turn-helix (wHTH) protein